MITWMQRHKKYLIITIWISTIAFVGAGFVGWGQYSYGDKAGAVAKVGEIEITMGDLQKSYSNLYSQYSQIFQGNFDEEKAKSFGLQKQALTSLVNQALVLNLAKSYDLQISDDELLSDIKTKKYFFKDGVFDKEIYKKVLSRNNMSIQDYEKDLRKDLLIQKLFKMLPVKANNSESQIIPTIMKIADKINYKVLNDSDISIDTSDKYLKPYWETLRQKFKTEVSYDVEVIKQEKLSKTYDDAKIKERYLENKTHFKDEQGKILPLSKAKEAVIAELNAKLTKDTALKTYIAYKKNKLSSDIKRFNQTISASSNPYTNDVLEKISKLNPKTPFLKPVLINGEYFIFKLTKTTPSRIKTYKEAKSELLPVYIKEQKHLKLLELAKNSIATFNGTTTDFITGNDVMKLKGLSPRDANMFLTKLFSQHQKRGFISIDSNKIVLYNILEQKLLENNNKSDDSIVKIKSAMFNEGLIKTLKNKYKTEIFIKGL